MAFSSGAGIVERDSQSTVISDASAIASEAFNAGTITALTPSDEVTVGDAVLDITFAVAPAVGAGVRLYRQDLNIDGANDAPTPDSDYKHTYLGTFPVDAVTSRQYVSLCNIALSADQNFYIENTTEETTTGTTIVKITPKTFVAKA